MSLTPEDADRLGRFLDDFERDYQRNRKIPEDLKAIEKLLAEIKADPADIRNFPDVKSGRGGKKFIDMTTDLDSIAKHVLLTRAKFESGEFELALSSAAELRARVDKANRRKTDRAQKYGQERLAEFNQGRRDRNEKIKMERRHAWAMWQAEAEIVWKKAPSLSKTRVAEIIRQKLQIPENPETIAKRIKNNPQG